MCVRRKRSLNSESRQISISIDQDNKCLEIFKVDIKFVYEINFFYIQNVFDLDNK